MESKNITIKLPLSFVQNFRSCIDATSFKFESATMQLIFTISRWVTRRQSVTFLTLSEGGTYTAEQENQPIFATEFEQILYIMVDFRYRNTVRHENFLF